MRQKKYEKAHLEEIQVELSQSVLDVTVSAKIQSEIPEGDPDTFTPVDAPKDWNNPWAKAGRSY